MSRDVRSPRQKANELIRRGENLAKVLQMSKTMQKRFKLIPKTALNNGTVAGIRDMSLGQVKDGEPVGANVIRFNSPSSGSGSDYPHISIDTKGVPKMVNARIPVSRGTIKAAKIAQSCLNVTGRALFVISLLASGVRVAKSVYDEVTIDDEIEGLEQIVSALEEDLEDDNCPDSTRAETEDALDYAKKLLNDAYDSKEHKGKKTLVTILCIGGEYGGAAAGGFAGAQAGAMVGAVGGPVGAVAGAVVGSVIGAVVGSEVGGSAVENFECNSNGVSTELRGSLYDWGKEDRGEVLGVKGNASVGSSGVELGASYSLLDLTKADRSKCSVLKMGSNLSVTGHGVDVGVQGTVLRNEVETEKGKLGVGLNFDTGFKLRDDGVKLEVLGFGFSSDKEGWGFKLPIFDMKFKK
ncbi:hypothetical protein Aduo_009578 [Ancylostoma duodenale]